MANNLIWYSTEIPKELVDLIEKDLNQFDKNFEQAKTYSGITLDKRDSKTTWIPSNHWIVGFCYHYILRANRENFLYDISGFDGESMQYTSYEKGEYYNWHIDAGIETSYKPTSNAQENFIITNTEQIRKLSFILQLSDPDDYEGGEVQLMCTNNVTCFAPKTRGTIIIFDSRTSHRVKKVLAGHRKSIVGWVVGKRWS
jgi:predicted 2-oxoglutarate/Fe(II)-dependent dioxygenase YbiX